eukprot:s1173_g9.t1
MQQGLIPGGPRRIRTSSMFIPFAPWDARAKELIKKKNTIPPINCAIFLTAAKLLKYGARLSPDGKIVIGQTVPFSDFDAVWYYDDIRKCPRRLMTMIGETQFISSIAQCKRVADVSKLHVVKRKVISDASVEDKEIVDRIKELDNKIDKKILSLQRGNEVWNELVSLFTLVFVPTQSGFTLCPGCLSETPSVYSLCVHCEGILFSHGCRQSIVQEEEQDENETTIPDEPFIDIHDHVKEAMKTMKEEEEESDTEMIKEELPEERPQIGRDDEDRIFIEGDDDEMEEVATDASGMQRKKQYEQEEQDAINANMGIASETVGSTDDTGPSTVVVEPDVSDPLVTLRIEQLTAVEDVQFRLSQKVRQWDFRTQEFTEESSRCLDASRRASMIMDLQVGVAIRDIIHRFYLRYVGGKPDSVEQFFLQKGNRRPDVDGDYPFYGVDEDGNYAEPPDEATLIDWAEKNWNRHPKEFVWRAYRGGLFFKKLIQYSLACGLKREDFQAEFGAVQTDKAVLAGTDERAKLQARSKALQDLERQSEFVRRLYRGAFDCKAYSYFRPDTQGMQDTLFFPPDEIVLATRENSRKISAIYMTDFHNYELPPKVLHAYYQEMEKVKLSGNYFPLWGVHLHQEHIKALTDAAPYTRTGT